ncbi:MAG: PDDEXK nuclease domain-containing protein [Fimbriimonas sp.]|nr:PDDEXK nuclease domain-containing protein [Fimbriimonas sp.]
MDDTSLTIPAEYGPFLEDLKKQIRSAQIRAVVAVNSELVMLYWNIGRRIAAVQETQGWGKKIVPALSADLMKAFPEMKGFSSRNLDYMLAFAKAWPDEPISQQLVAKLPWGHNIHLLQTIDDPQTRRWYAEKALTNGWSRNVLSLQIKSRLHERQGAAPTNFGATLPAPQSDLANNLLKDPYNFDFLGLSDESHEREIEKALVVHVRKFLLELGVGFAFVGSQYPIEVAGEDFFLDLLFYHVRLHCFVVIELKATKFKPEYAGKLNFYLSAVDDLLRTEGDAPTIGLILCQDKNRVLAEYALRDMSKPIGVSTFQLTESLPEEIRTALPTIEQLEQELSESSASQNS